MPAAAALGEPAPGPALLRSHSGWLQLGCKAERPDLGGSSADQTELLSPHTPSSPHAPLPGLPRPPLLPPSEFGDTLPLPWVSTACPFLPGTHTTGPRPLPGLQPPLCSFDRSLRLLCALPRFFTLSDPGDRCSFPGEGSASPRNRLLSCSSRPAGLFPGSGAPAPGSLEACLVEVAAAPSWAQPGVPGPCSFWPRPRQRWWPA